MRVDAQGRLTWKVQLSTAAGADLQDIVKWTTKQFGVRQARSYAETISAALQALSSGPTITGVKARDDISKGIHALHVAREGHKGRHFLLFRVSKDRPTIEVLRLLHDAMDLPRHLIDG
jgi:toxin ParE1/3/4